MPASAAGKDRVLALIEELSLVPAPAIYELKGDTLRFCLPSLGARQRPISFTPEKGSRETSFLLKRVEK